MNSIDHYAMILWDYLQLHEAPTKSDIILCLCSHDTRVAERASQLMLEGLGTYLVFSGGVGKLTEGLFTQPEAEVFSQVAIKMGVPAENIMVETKSTNTGENIRFTFDLLKAEKIQADQILLVQKPFMERRTFATFRKQWPDQHAMITVTSPQLSYDEYVNNGLVSKDTYINVMVGDMQRIREYPELGFQIPQEIPHGVWEAYEELVKLGFDKHLITT